MLPITPTLPPSTPEITVVVKEVKVKHSGVSVKRIFNRGDFTERKGCVRKYYELSRTKNKNKKTIDGASSFKDCVSTIPRDALLLSRIGR